MILAINTLLPLALAIIMFALGLGLTISHFLAVVQRPRTFAIGAFSQLIVLPVTAFAVAKLFALPPELALGLVILSLCPGGPTSSFFTKLGKGDVALSISLTAVITFVSVFTIPVFAKLAAGYFLTLDGVQIEIGGLAIRFVFITLLPALLGMTVRHFMPEKISLIEPIVSKLAVLIVAALVAVSLILNWDAFVQSIGVLLIACLVIMLAMLASGLLLSKIFGLTAATATTISVDTAMQNGAMGIIIGTLIMNQPDTVSLVSVPSGVYGVMMYFVCLPFVLWRRQKAG